MKTDPDEQAFIASILKQPKDEGPLLVYADWLEDRQDERAQYVRDQVAFRHHRTEELRQRLQLHYPDRHLPWVNTFEQTGVFDANLTEFEFEWWGTGIGPARPAGGTYQRYLFSDQPPLPVEQFGSQFEWLTQTPSAFEFRAREQWRRYCQQARQDGYYVPAAFDDFMTSIDLPGRIKSCTDNYFVKPYDPTDQFSAPARVAKDGLCTTFYADSQYCILWAINFPRAPATYAPIIAGPPDCLFPQRRHSTPNPDEYEGGDQDEGEWDEGDIEARPALAGSTFEGFMYRWWIENEIWYATIWDETKRNLLPHEQRYLDHLNSGYGQ